MWIVTIHAAVVMVVRRSWSCSSALELIFLREASKAQSIPINSLRLRLLGSKVSSLSCYLIVPTINVDPNLWLWGLVSHLQALGEYVVMDL